MIFKLFTNNKNSLAAEIKGEITTRILFCLLLLFIGIFILSITNVVFSLEQLERNVKSQCKDIESFTISQLLIDNKEAIKLSLKDINAQNSLIHFQWIEHEKPISKNELQWKPPFSWSYNYPIISPDNDYFGYFRVTGSLIYSKILLIQLLTRIAVTILFSVMIFFLLYPLGKKIPQRLFVKPVTELLTLLKEGCLTSPTETEKKRSKRSRVPIEIEEIKSKILQMLKEAEIHSRKAALGQIAAKVAHDIRSPLAALNMMQKKQITALPEEQRNMMLNAIQRINDIANNLLSKHQNNINDITAADNLTIEPAVTLLEKIVSEKRAQYDDKPIEFQLNVAENTHGTFIKVNANEFQRSLSNLINNAVEAISSEKGIVTMRIFRNSESAVVFSIKDNGCGIPEDLLPKILDGASIGKKAGTGIGLSSAKKSIEAWGGQFSIQSQAGKGTIVTITLSETPPPLWFTPELIIKQNTTVVLLDDDNLIHEIWNNRFEKTEGVEVIHFYDPNAFLEWHNHHQNREAFFLIDYELIGSPFNGLDIMEKANIVHRSVLVTSRYDDSEVQSRIKKIKAKLIPKTFAVHIPIRILCETPDLIFVDDSTYLTEAWEAHAKLSGKKIAIFHQAEEVERFMHHFSKDTPFYIDSNLNGGIKGEHLAKKLHDEGFTTLYLATGADNITLSDIPWIKKIVGKEYPDSL